MTVVKITVNIKRCIQDFQDMSANPGKSVMRSKIEFDLLINGQQHAGLHVLISQPYGVDYATEPLEVGTPVGYNGPFAYNAFANEVERYYRNLVGQSGSMISIGPGCSVRMSNNMFVVPHSFEIEAEDGKGNAW